MNTLENSKTPEIALNKLNQMSKHRMFGGKTHFQSVDDALSAADGNSNFCYGTGSVLGVRGIDNEFIKCNKILEVMKKYNQTKNSP